MAITAQNKGDGNYVVHRESFFLNVKTPENAWETVGGNDSSVLTLAPGEVREVKLEFSPVLKTDTQVSVKYLKYVGGDKRYFTFDLKDPLKL